jgi:hypothetical protein
MTLKELIDSDGANAAKSDADVLAWCLELVSRNKTSLRGDELFNAADITEQDALTAAQRSEWLALCGRDSIDPFGAANVALVIQIFGNPSNTRTALLALRVEQVARIVDAGVSSKNLGTSLINSVRAV